MRLEFTKETMRMALKRADGCCEGLISSGERCSAVLAVAKYHFDHIIPAAIGGDNDLTNCAVLCLQCHKDKTTKRDIPIIAKSKRIYDKHHSIRKPSRFPGSRDSKWKIKVNGEVVPR